MIIRALEVTLALGLTLSIFVGAPIFALAGLYSLKFGECVRLPNGTEIGYEAYVDFGNAYFRPDAVLRDPKGSVIAKEVWPIHVTEEATLGRALPEHNSGKSALRFIWTGETGLVKEAENPELYRRLSLELSETYYGAPKDLNVNTLWLLKRLMKEARFKSDNCNTSLWTW